VGIVGKSKSLDFPTMLIFWSLVRNSVVLAVYLLFSVACFLTVHEHLLLEYHHKELIAAELADLLSDAVALVFYLIRTYYPSNFIGCILIAADIICTL
ncbi:MAG: hypothetical protein IIT46_13020, partial [Lachnospiraceae bacterium]|nr:hypothetical protein [Lachnospiraceae bacterium]